MWKRLQRHGRGREGTVGPMEIEDVATPALVLNVDALERNLQRMANDCRAAGVALRPHTKTHKSPWIARRQLRLGASGVCAAKVGEAEVLVHSGVGDVLITTDLVPATMGKVTCSPNMTMASTLEMSGARLLMAAATEAPTF